jgi:predicted nucleic acid-binding protein
MVNNISDLSYETVSGTSRGRNLTLSRCYPDTCVLVDAFLENPNKPSEKNKAQKIKDAKEFFKRYDGPQLLTSPIVLAEFMATATNPNKPFKKSYGDAVQLIEKLFTEEHFSLSVPKVNLHSNPLLSLPFFNYSIKVEGKAKIGTQTSDAILTFSKGRTFKAGFSTGLIQTPKNIYENAEWATVTLSSALYDLFLSVAKESTSASGGPLQLQDALVLSFSRGHKYVHFITSDRELVDRAGAKPYPDVEVFELSCYLRSWLANATGTNKI